MQLLLDTGYVNAICNPRLDPKFVAWLEQKRKDDPDLVLVLPEIVDYEVRRALLWRLKKHSKQGDEGNRRLVKRFLARLDSLPRTQVRPLPTTKAVLDRAAELWGTARSEGRATASRDRIDIDVIVASHALEEGAQVATKNIKHISNYGATIATVQ